MFEVSPLFPDKDLLVVNCLSFIQIFVAVFFSGTVIQVVIGFPLILFFPGYVVLCAMFPSKKNIDRIERLALSIGLSVAIVPIIGLMLNYTPWGIQLYPVLVSLFVFNFLMSFIAAKRRNAVPEEERLLSSLELNLPKIRALGSQKKPFAAVLAVCLSILVAASAYLVVSPAAGSFTEFYILGPEGKIANYPVNLTVGENGTLIIGIVNHENKDAHYNITVDLNNTKIGEIDEVALTNGKIWQQNFTFASCKTGSAMWLQFLLYSDVSTSSEPYRTLQLPVSVKEH